MVQSSRLCAKFLNEVEGVLNLQVFSFNNIDRFSIVTIWRIFDDVKTVGLSYLKQHNLPPTKEEVYVFARVRLFVCLSVCEQDYSKRRAWIWMKMKCCVSSDVGTWTNWLTFQPDPYYSPDAGTGLLSPISYALQHAIYVGKISPMGLGCSDAWFYNGFTASRLNNFVGGTCALPSALVLSVSN